MLKFKNVNIIFIVLLIVFTLFQNTFDFSYWWLLGIIILWLIITAIGSFHIRWNYFLKAYHKNYEIKDQAVALTFDDGPNPEFTPLVLDLLAKYDAKATFFLIGKNVEKHPEITKQIIKEEHTIGNHSFAHSNNYGFLSTQNVIADIKITQEIVKDISNLNMQFFRPPFGVTNPNIAKSVKKLKLKTFGWSIRSLDTMEMDPDRVFNKISSKIKKGDVILMHDNSERSIIILEKLLQFLKNKKLKSVTLEHLFDSKAYE